MCGIDDVRNVGVRMGGARNVGARIGVARIGVARLVALTDYPWRCRAVGANWNENMRKCNSIAANSAKGATSQRVVREGYYYHSCGQSCGLNMWHPHTW